VSEAAISRRVKQLRLHASKVVDQHLTASQRLRHIQDVIAGQLDWAEQQAMHPGTDRAALADLLVRLSGQMRAQLRLEHDVTRTLVDL
jgi:hypothetical protein